MQTEHRVADVEGYCLHAMYRIGGSGCDPITHGAGFVNAFLQHLAVFALFVEHQLVMVFWNVVLTLLIPDAYSTEHAFHAESA